MKNLMVMVFAIILASSTLFVPHGAYADGGINMGIQNTASLEAQLNVAQKELVVLLNKKVEILKAELVLTFEQKLLNLRLQLIGLLQQKITLLRAELNNR